MGIARAIEGYQADEHYFKPEGYSLNAIRENHYMTVHISPVDGGCHMSVKGDYDGDPLELAKEAAQASNPDHAWLFEFGKADEAFVSLSNSFNPQDLNPNPA